MQEREIHLRDYFRVVVKRRNSVLTFFAIVFVVVLLATLSATPIYMATTKVMIEKNMSANIPTMNYYYFAYDPDFYETQHQLIRSTSVAQKVVKILSLERDYERYMKDSGAGFNVISGTFRWFRNLFSVFTSVSGISRAQNSRENSAEDNPDELLARADNLARMISASLVVSPIKNSKMVNISYMSTNPELAALIVNTVAKAYMEEILDMKMNSSRLAMQWLTQKADEERVKLEQSENALQEYMRKNDIVTLENRLALVPEKLSEVANRIATAETKRKELESLYNKVKDLSRSPAEAETIPAIASDPTIQSLRAQIIKSEQNIAEIAKKFGAKHPVMITAQEDLKGLREKKEQEIRRAVETIKNEYDLAKANEDNFRRLASQTKSETLNLSERFIQYEALKRETETNKQVFDAIIKKIKEQSITQDVQTIDVWVVEKAEVPTSAAKPRKAFNMLVGLLIGLFGGIGMAFFIEYLDNTVKSPDEAEKRLKVPVLGVVTLMKPGETTIDEIVMKEPRSAFAESYKAIRTAVMLSSASGPPRNILITSISPEEGKTVTSTNLALTIAHSDRSVLLVDGDLRKPRVHKIFGIENTKGLSTYLAGASDSNIITEGVAPNLSIIPSGPIPPNPSELLGSGRMQDLIALLNSRFDVVIWDSAPLLTVTDSLILSKTLDCTILVAKAGKTTYESLSRGLKSLKDLDSRVLGIVINALDIKKTDYYYQNYYHYYYADRDNPDKKDAPGAG